jgi:hypothetical protein
VLSAGVAMGSQEPALEIGNLAMDQRELNGGTLDIAVPAAPTPWSDLVRVWRRSVGRGVFV